MKISDNKTSFEKHSELIQNFLNERIAKNLKIKNKNLHYSFVIMHLAKNEDLINQRAKNRNAKEYVYSMQHKIEKGLLLNKISENQF